MRTTLSCRCGTALSLQGKLVLLLLTFLPLQRSGASGFGNDAMTEAIADGSPTAVAVTQLSLWGALEPWAERDVMRNRTLLHLTCFGQANDNPSSSSCCRLFLLTLDHFLCHDHNDREEWVCAAWMDRGMGNDDRKDGPLTRTAFDQSCLHSIAFVPPPPPPPTGTAQQQQQQQQSPKFYLSIRLPSEKQQDAAQQWVAEFDETLTISATRRLYGKCVLSPFHLAMDEPSFEGSGKSNEEEECDSTSQTNVLDAKVSSQVSTTGGMHREQTISVQISSKKIMDKTYALCQSPRGDDEKHGSDSCSTGLILQGRLSLLLPLTQGMYIDVDEFYAGDKSRCLLGIASSAEDASACPLPTLSTASSCQVKLLASPQQIMDIEQPSFVSPQHVVRFLLHLNHEVAVHHSHSNDSCPEFELEWKFSTILHTRYPLPQKPTVQLPLEGYRREATPIPLLAAEESVLELSASKEQQEQTGNFMVWKVRNKHLVDDSQWIEIAAPGVTLFYYWFVAIITMSSSLWGAAVMMRDILSLTSPH